jgi:hypothetical protein
MTAAKHTPTRRLNISAKEMREAAERALAYLREHDQEPGRGFGFAWATLARIAGVPDLPLPSEERMAAIKAAQVPHE